MRPILFAAVVLSLTASLFAQGDPLKGFPEEYGASLRKALHSFLQRDYETAIAHVDKAEQVARPTPLSLNIRGAVAIEQKRFEEGRQHCIEALKLDPKFYPAHFNLAEIPFVQGRYAEARNLFEKLREANPNDDLSQFRIFLTYLLEKNDSAAQGVRDQIPFLSNSPIYYYSEAAWEFAHGNEKAAHEWIERGKFVFPPSKTLNYAAVFYDLGWLKRPESGESK